MAKNRESTTEQGTRTMETPRAEQPSPNSTAPRYGADDVARRAYQRFLERGGQHGHDMDDWFEAERELQAQGADQSATPPHGDELAVAPEHASAAPKGKGPTRGKKGPTAHRPDRAADQQ